MTESAAPIEHVRSDALPPITPAQAAAFQEACAAAAFGPHTRASSSSSSC
jgi:hypothetical protein